MRVLLIGAPLFLRVYMPPLGLGYVAAALEADGHEVDLVSLTTLPVPRVSDLQDAVRRFRPDVVGHTVLSPSAGSSRTVFQAVRAVDAHPVLVAGGAHPTALPRHSLTWLGADVAVMGEGENTLRELVRALEGGEDLSAVQGIAYRENGGIHQTPPRPFQRDVDALPVPAWHLIRPEAYPQVPPQGMLKSPPATMMITSRGCPYECSFCASFRTMGRAHRLRDPGRVVDEMEILRDRHGIREIMLVDLNFTFTRRHAVEVCEEMLRRDFRITWKPLAGFRIDHVDEDLLRLFKRTGCYQVIFGIESFNACSLERLNKDLDVAIVQDRIRMAKRMGLNTASFFIVAMPGETESEVRHTMRMARKSSLDFAGFFCWTPMPGAADWEAFEKTIDLDHFTWERLNYDEAAYSDRIPRKRLKRLLFLGHFLFYANPGRMWKLLSLVRPRSFRYFLAFAFDTLFGSRGRLRLR